ncbi:hypothetical protein FOZ63_025233, partial [Perkinsus olseni]
MYSKGGGGGYWQQQGYGKGKAAAYPGQRWGDGPYGSRDGSWQGWQQQGSKGKGGHFHKGGGGRKGKGKGGHRWHDAESMRDLPIQSFVQDDMVEDPWTSLYPKDLRNATRLQEQRDGVVLRDKLRRLSMVDGPEELLESLDSANRLATQAYHRSHMFSER